MVRLFWACLLVVGSLATGKALNRCGQLPQSRAEQWVRWVIILFSPITLIISVWGIDFTSGSVWTLPLLAVFLSFATAVPAFLFARSEKLTSAQKGSFLTCAFFSNVGYFGGLIAFAVYGEKAYGLCMLYMTLFTPCFFTLGFWLAERYGTKRVEPHEEAISRVVRALPIIGMVIGLVLSLSGFARPEPLVHLNRLLIPTYTGLYLVGIGSQLQFELPRRWIKACCALSLLKFIYTPLLALLCCNLLGIQGLVKTVVILEASTPVAVSPLLFPMLFGLDRPLSNALWLFTTIVAIPWFVVLIHVFPPV